ncbi:RDD family protein [Psychroserpens algicola]|uniref:RDD family protein n=1 Tax=Psychroserpens algicola TaxID=1719034 RepID=A0ABT0H9D6_9FLAO|nr:RDD family protein [Psychroserpens algicola]MCK8480996.1 RDD family protein [Psychroserpens algicola]
MNHHAKYRITQDVLASKGKRFLNFIIDYIILYLLSFALGIAIALISELTGSYELYEFIALNDNFWVSYILGMFIWLFYYTLIETFTKGRTIGKYITKTTVVLFDGSKPTINEILIRSLCRLIPFEQFSFLGQDAKGWHDSLSKTYVVDVEKFEAKRATMNELNEIGKIGVD